MSKTIENSNFNISENEEEKNIWEKDENFCDIIETLKNEYKDQNIEPGHIDQAFLAYNNENNASKSLSQKQIIDKTLKRFGYGTDEMKENIDLKSNESASTDNIKTLKETYTSLRTQTQEVLNNNEDIDIKKLADEIEEEIAKITTVDTKNIYGTEKPGLADTMEKMLKAYNNFLLHLKKDGEIVENYKMSTVTENIENYINDNTSSQSDKDLNKLKIQEMINNSTQVDIDKLENDLLQRKSILNDLLNDINSDNITSTNSKDEVEKVNIDKKEDKSKNIKLQIIRINIISQLINKKQ